MKYGFIITRNVNSELTNNYWNNCIIYIRRLYPTHKIIVIDDNSDKQYIKNFYEYKNVEVIESEYKKRGEILPYYYFYKNHFFENAIILHDSVFMQTKINFDYLIQKNIKVLPIWHFNNEKKENIYNTLKIASSLNNSHEILYELQTDKKFDILGKINNEIWSGCFGVQSIINYNFLVELEKKYSLFNLLNVIHSRKDRCCLERIMGVIFFIEYLKEKKLKSILGEIKSYCPWGYTYLQHCENIKNKKILKLPIVKVWSGR